MKRQSYTMIKHQVLESDHLETDPGVLYLPLDRLNNVSPIYKVISDTVYGTW